MAMAGCDAFHPEELSPALRGTARRCAGNLLVAEVLGGRIRKIAPDGTISTIAGIPNPYNFTVDSRGAVFVASGDSRVRRIDPGGVVTVVAGSGPGTGVDRSQGDGGPAVNATLNEPKGVAVDATGNIYIADTTNARLRMVDRNGIIRTVAGPGTLGQDYWNAVAIDPRGQVLLAITHVETASTWSVVARVNSDGSLTTIAGNRQNCGSVEFKY